MLKPLIIFFVSKPNVYSFAKLLSIIEHNPNLLLLYDVKVERASPYKITTQKLRQHQLDKRPFVIFPISLMTAQIGEFQKFLKYTVPSLRKLNPNLHILVGGWHASGNPQGTLEMGADFVISGQAENSLPKFLYQFIQNPTHIPKIFSNQDKVDLERYTPFSEKYRVFCPIEISRGCPFRCKFCQTGQQYPIMNHVSVETILKWTKKAVEIRYDRVWVTTPNAFAYGSPKGGGTNPYLVEKLLKSMKDIENLDEIYFGTFPSEVRPEYVTKEMMGAVHPYISNKFFTIGVQSASDRLLKEIWRGHTFQQVLDAIDMILDYGYGVDLDFIFGLPGETQQDLHKTLDFFKDVLKSSKKIRIHTHTFMPLPGTPFANEPVGVILPEVENILGKLASRNKAYGSHDKQSKF